MKSYRNLKATLLAVHIEYHWNHILRCRKKANRLIDNGAPLNSHQMLRLNQRLTRHSLAAMRKQRCYEAHFVPPLKARQGAHNF